MLDRIQSYINDRYGSRRGLSNHYKFGLQYRLGVFDNCAQIDWRRVQRLIFICHGNICRSPLASAYAQQRFQLDTESFGLACRTGSPADPRAIDFARQQGIGLAGHVSRNIDVYVPSQSDLVIGMEPAHLNQIAPEIKSIAQLTLAGLWLNVPHPYIHDPYMSRGRHFESCETLVIKAVEGMALCMGL